MPRGRRASRRSRSSGGSSRDAEDELGRAPASLAFSGIAAGLSGEPLGLAAAAAEASGATEHPTAVGHRLRDELRRRARVALLAMTANAVPGAVERALVDLGDAAARQSFAHVFASEILGGWITALVAWIVAGSHWTIGQVAVIWFLTFLVGIGHLAHCVATSGEVLAWTLDGPGGAGDDLRWLAAAALGNVVGGLGIVTLLNYGQVRAGEDEALGSGVPRDES